MNRRELFQKLAATAKDQGRRLLARHGRPLGDKLAARLSRAGVERGLLEAPLDMDEIVRRLKQLRESGAISGDEMRELLRQLKEHFLHRFGSR